MDISYAIRSNRISGPDESMYGLKYTLRIDAFDPRVQRSMYNMMDKLPQVNTVRHAIMILLELRRDVQHTSLTGSTVDQFCEYFVYKLPSSCAMSDPCIVECDVLVNSPDGSFTANLDIFVLSNTIESYCEPCIDTKQSTC